MSERTAMDRYLDRLLRCLEAAEEADKVKRRQRRSIRELEAEMMADYERWKRRIEQRRDPELPENEV
jgi:hypothetical protein